VLKAIAYGADAVFLDYETPLWGLHLEGKAGLTKLLDLINEELKLCMVLTHCVNIKQVTER
jgi:isopentenyl diphosphate isomerase/L-lactate dehydrogenase-like FMN-dependent dehydrogenase